MKVGDWDEESFRKQIVDEGCCLIENVLDKDTVEKLKLDTKRAIDMEAEYHGTPNHMYYGSVQACPMYGGEFLSLLENRKLIEPFNTLMGEGCIIWSYISSSLPPMQKNFSTRIHVDRPRLFPNYIESVGALIFLDDVFDENGATWYLPRSHNRPDEPSEEEFYASAIRLRASAGSVFYFNLRLWHAAGHNHTGQWRHTLAIGVVRPYLKQKFDYPKMLSKHGIDTNQLSDYVKQKLGFFAIPPSSLDEYWGPVEKRTYREKSEWEMAKLGY